MYLVYAWHSYIKEDMFCLDRLNLFDKVQESFKHTELKTNLPETKC